MSADSSIESSSAAQRRFKQRFPYDHNSVPTIERVWGEFARPGPKSKTSEPEKVGAANADLMRCTDEERLDEWFLNVLALDRLTADCDPRHFRFRIGNGWQITSSPGSIARRSEAESKSRHFMAARVGILDRDRLPLQPLIPQRRDDTVGSRL